MTATGAVEAIDEPLLPFCGGIFGAVYDVVTVLMLCLAGTSVMTALRALLPMFLLRFGMELRWANRWGVMLITFAVINLLVTLLFQANVEDQRGAYATGVLVLIACAAVVTVFDKKQLFERLPGKSWRILFFLNAAYYSVVALIFVTTMLAVAMRSASGLGISLCFVAAILAMSIVSRAWRADELRTIGFEFKDEQSKFLWDSLRLADFPVLVPLHAERESRDETERRIRADHQLAPNTDIVFVEIEVDDPSDFFQKLSIEVARENNRYIIKATMGVSVAHAIGGHRTGDVALQQTAGAAFRLARARPAVGELELPGIRRGQHPVEGARVDPTRGKGSCQAAARDRGLRAPRFSRSLAPS